MTKQKQTAGKTAEQITEEFFRKRFPEKYIAFEIQCGYFGEWVARFKSGQPENHMDSQSLKVWEEMMDEDEFKGIEGFKRIIAKEIKK